MRGCRANGSRSRLPLTIATSHSATIHVAGIEALRFQVPEQVGVVQYLDGRGVAHPSDQLEKLALEDRYLEAVLLASSLSNSVAKTCFAFPTCGTALAWSTLPGFPTTIIATIPMP